jgi:putative transposase
LKPAAKRELVAVLQTEHGLSERPACEAIGLQRSVYDHEPRPNADGPIVKLLLELAWQRPQQGFGKLFKRLRRQGHGWNHKRVYRIYCSLKLNKRRKGKRRLPTRCPAPLVVPRYGLSQKEISTSFIKIITIALMLMLAKCISLNLLS